MHEGKALLAIWPRSAPARAFSLKTRRAALQPSAPHDPNPQVLLETFTSVLRTPAAQLKYPPRRAPRQRAGDRKTHRASIASRALARRSLP